MKVPNEQSHIGYDRSVELTLFRCSANDLDSAWQCLGQEDVHTLMSNTHLCSPCVAIDNRHELVCL